MTLCVICGDEVKGRGRGKNLTTGEAVCRDCMAESLEVVTCEECSGLFRASQAARLEIGYIFCLDCLEKGVIEKLDELGDIEANNKERADDGLKPYTADQYVAYLEREVKNAVWSRAEKRIAERLIRER